MQCWFKLSLSLQLAATTARVADAASTQHMKYIANSCESRYCKLCNISTDRNDLIIIYKKKKTLYNNTSTEECFLTVEYQTIIVAVNLSKNLPCFVIHFVPSSQSTFYLWNMQCPLFDLILAPIALQSNVVLTELKRSPQMQTAEGG